MALLSPRATRLCVGVLCLLGAARVLLGSAALPLFHDVDEQAHFDLVHKFSRGYWPAQPHERWDRETAELETLYGSPEFRYRPGLHPGGVYPPPVRTWAPSPERDAYLERRTLAKTRLENHEAHSPPLYYLAGAAWYTLGTLAGLSGPGAAYWLRFLNAPLFALLIAAAFLFCRAHFSRPVALAVPALLAAFPSTVFFGVTSDALAPLAGLLALWALLEWLARPAPAARLSLLAGLVAAAALLVKLSNVAFAALPALAAAWRWRQARRSGAPHDAWRPVTPLLFGLGLPVAGWLLLNGWLLGDVTGTAAKVRSLGWRQKPLGALLDHPLFSFSGQGVFWSRLTASFFEGDMNWHGYPALSFLPSRVLFAAAFALPPLALALAWHRGRRDPAARLPTAVRACALVLAGSALFLVVQSLLWDFGTGAYPSREFPYLCSGRLMAGAIVPLLALNAWGVETLLARRPAARPALPAVAVALALAVAAALMLAPQARLLAGAMESRHNRFHYSRPGSASDALTGLGLVALNEARFDEAAARFSRAADVNPADVAALANLGLTLAAQGNHDLAARAYGRALQARPGSAQLHAGRGTARAALGQWADAAANFGEAVRLAPREPLRRLPLALALAGMGRLAEAEGEYEALLRLSRDWPKRTGPAPRAPAHHPDRTARRVLAARFVQAAEQADGAAVVDAGGSRTQALEHLAVAYSLAERTGETIAAARLAVRSAESGGEGELAARLGERLRAYQERQTAAGAPPGAPPDTPAGPPGGPP